MNSIRINIWTSSLKDIFTIKMKQCNTVVIKVDYYTYIIGHYKPLVRIIDLASHTTYIECVNFIHKWRNLQFKTVGMTDFFHGILFDVRSF